MRKIKFVALDRQYKALRKQILARFDRVSKSGQYITGSAPTEFAIKFADFCETRYALGVASGSDALYLSLHALGIGKGDEVITAPNSFVATAWAIQRTGAKVVFADVGDDMNIDPELIKKAVNARTKAIVPVHLTGRVADMDPILDVANHYKLHVVEDAAQAVGARYRGKRAGSFGICAAFSLHPLKNLHVHGDGGVITTNNKRLYLKLTMLGNHGLRNRDICSIQGINSRLDSIHAATAEIKLKYLEKWNRRMRTLAGRYSRDLHDYVLVPQVKPYEEPCYHRYIIRTNRRNRLSAYLAEQGIETKVHYPVPIHLQPAAKSMKYKRGDFPVTEKLAKTMLSLPLYPELKDEEIEYVISKIKSYYEASSKKT